VYNQDGDVQTNLQHSDANDIIRLGDHLLIVEGTRLIELNPEDGSVIRSIERGEDYSAALAASPDGRVWGAGSQGMYYLMPDGTEYIKICDSTRYLIGAPDAMVTGLCALDGGTLVVEMGGNSGSLSLRPVGGNVAMQGFGMRIGGGGMADYAVYTYDANLDISSAREFTVTALHYSRKLHQVVSNFQREHPELDVRMEIIMPDDDTETPLLDGIRVLNTRLFSGFAGDILILDSLNLNRYIARGLLKPLDALAADLGLLPGIWEGSHSDDGHIYYVPAAFSMETLWGLAERIAGVDSVLSLLSRPLDDGQYLFYPRTPEQLLTLFYPACEGAFLNANGKPDFSSAAFKDFLNTLLEMFLLQGEIPAADSGPFSGRISSGRQARAMANFGEMQALINGAAALSVTSVMSLMQLSIPYTFMGAEESGFISIPSLYDQGAAYRPILMAGISAQTSQDALCEAFLQSLFSDEIQNLETGGEGLPSCLKAFEKIVEDTQALNASSSMMRTAMFASDGGNPIEMKQPDDACYDALTTLAKNVYIPIFEDETLMAFITEETAAFFRGEISAETAQNALYIRTMAYLNE
jgi:multiple sugar transport system substrate-binding protein